MNWVINLENLSLGGYAPAWYKSTYPTYGNKNHAGAMQNCDLTDPTSITQGSGLASLTAGTEAGSVSTLIKGISKVPASSDLAFAVGGNKLYEITSTAVSVKASAPVLPHTIDNAGGTAELGEDVCYFQGALYYSYNYTTGADVGKYTLVRDNDTNFDDDWLSAVPTGKFALGAGVPHQMINAGNDFMYIANGRYVSSWDGTTATEQDLDLPTGTVISSLAWAQNRLWIAANLPNLTGTNKNTASIYIWDGNATSWEEEIRVMGRITALHVKNGIVYVFYEDISSSGGYKLGYLNGTTITDLANFTGALPAYYQVADYKDFIIWVSSDLIFAWGSGDKDLPIRLFQLADGGYSTVGGLANPFGTPFVASNQTTSYKIAKFSGYDVASNWKSLLFDITGDKNQSVINQVRINFEVLAANARVDWSLVNNKGATLYTDTISYTKHGATTTINTGLKIGAENFRLEFDYTNGNATNPVKIKNARIYGYTN